MATAKGTMKNGMSERIEHLESSCGAVVRQLRGFEGERMSEEVKGRKR